MHSFLVLFLIFYAIVSIRFVSSIGDCNSPKSTYKNTSCPADFNHIIFLNIKHIASTLLVRKRCANLFCIC